MKLRKRIYILMILILFQCSKDYKEERKQWAMQYRDKIQADFTGYSTIENLLKNFLESLSKQEGLDHYLLTKEEYLKVYWANEDWNKIFDKGMTLENVWYVYDMLNKKNITTWNAKLKHEKLQFWECKIQDIRELGTTRVYRIQTLKVKKNQQILDLPLVKYIVEHNQKYKILSLNEAD